MMKQLILNELRHSRMTMAILGVVAASVAAAGALSPDPDLTVGFRMLLLVVPFYFGLSLAAMSFRTEGRGGTWRLLRALPATGATVVSAKFAGSLLTLLAGSGVAAAGLAVADRHLDLGRALATLSLPFLGSVALLAVSYWLCFLIGERNAAAGMIAILAALQITGMLQFAAAPQGGGPGGMIAAIERWARWATTAPGMAACALGAGLVLTACWISSIRIYDARDITRQM